MDINIHVSGDPKEIADLAEAMQSRRIIQKEVQMYSSDVNLGEAVRTAIRDNPAKDREQVKVNRKEPDHD